MPRVGSAPDNQSSGGLFSFEEGNGEIVAAKVVNHAIPGYSTDCGYMVSIQRLDKDWKATNDEPIDEFLKAGPCEDKQGEPLFHPGKAASSDDENPELEIGGKLDVGGEDEAEGTCLLTAGRGPDKKSKLSVFSNSCIEHGVKPGLFNGYAANLIGLKAHFTQFMMERPKNSTAKNDPTCLIIGAQGQTAGGKIVQYPFAQTGGKPATSAKGTAAAKTVAKAPAGKPNGVPAPSTDTGSGGGASDEVEAAAIAMLLKVGESIPGQTIERAKLKSRLLVLYAKNRAEVPIAYDKQINALVMDDTWFPAKVEELGWSVEGGAVTIPAA
jgi:hypothetical protein